MKKITKNTLVIGVFLSYGLYSAFGYFAVMALPTTLLIDHWLYSGNITKKWSLLPMKRALFRHAILSKSESEIQKDFRSYGYTLYSGAIGYRDSKLPRGVNRSVEEAGFLRDVTSFAHRSGVGLDWMDPVGCKAIHQALIEEDIASAKFLLTLNAGESTDPSAAAGYKLCKLDLRKLAELKGLSLN